MAKHAGFALTQGPNFGRIDCWNDWKPTDQQTQWLLLSGSSDPPKGVTISERRPREAVTSKGGPFLQGMHMDFSNMIQAILRNNLELFSVKHSLRMTINDAERDIKDLFEVCQNEEKKAVIYYTGHGEVGTGNWCFMDGTMSIEEIEKLKPSGCSYPFIISDCCYSGNWADYCLNSINVGFDCLAACPYYSTAVDINTEGGEWTCYMTNQHRDASHLTNAPVYSRNDDESCPFDKKIENYIDLFFVYLKSNRSVKCHTIANGKLSAIFHRKEGGTQAELLHSVDFEGFKKFFKTQEGKICSSFSCDDNNFLMVFQEDGASQKYLHGNTKVIDTEISKASGEHMKITGCGAHKSSWIIIMTSGIPGLDIWTTCSYWIDVIAYVDKHHPKGYTLKGLCYNLGLKKYFLYMQKTSKVGMGKSFKEGNLKEAREWLKEHHNEYQVSHIFKDPADNNLYIGLEQTDSPHIDLDLAFDFSTKK